MEVFLFYSRSLLIVEAMNDGRLEGSNASNVSLALKKGARNMFAPFAI